MGLALIYSRSLIGMDCPLIKVEAHISNGLPSFSIVGLPDVEVKESKDRVRAAIIQSGYNFPAKKIIINLAPADLPKESGRFDLPIAISILVASGQIQNTRLHEFEFAGELALSGELRSIKGTILMLQQSIKENRYFILPEINAKYSLLLNTDKELGATTLLEVASFLNGIQPLQSKKENLYHTDNNNHNLLDINEIKGQETAKYAIEVAAAGGHNILLIGPPGTGKSMIANRLPTIMPKLTKDELLENISLYSLLDSNFSSKNINFISRPFRNPHHSASAVAIIGGGANPRPGEISLANNGILFLDELPEFNKSVLESLREPLETGEINISRATYNTRFPANFQLIAAMNPCPCGYYDHPTKECTCSREQINRYQKKVSGPFLDRMDLIIPVSVVQEKYLLTKKSSDSSKIIKERVIKARQIQYKRQNKINAKLNINELDTIANIDFEAKKNLTNLMEKLNLSVRSFHKILKTARTIADLNSDERTTDKHILKAISLRRQLLYNN